MTTIICDARQSDLYIYEDAESRESYVYIRLNERVETDDDGNNCFIYDYNEFHGRDLPLDDIRANPQNYLYYKVQTPESQLDRIENMLSTITQALLGGNN